MTVSGQKSLKDEKNFFRLTKVTKNENKIQTWKHFLSLTNNVKNFLNLESRCVRVQNKKNIQGKKHDSVKIASKQQKATPKISFSRNLSQQQQHIVSSSY